MVVVGVERGAAGRMHTRASTSNACLGCMLARLCRFDLAPVQGLFCCNDDYFLVVCAGSRLQGSALAALPAGPAQSRWRLPAAASSFKPLAAMRALARTNPVS